MKKNRKHPMKQEENAVQIAHQVMKRGLKSRVI
jgi:hypothetical protein